MGNFIHTLIIYPITQIIEFAFSFGYKIFGNTGISVLGVSLAVSLLTLPLYIIAESWQEVERDIQKKMKPGLTRIKQAFSGDERYMMTTTFYRQHHYNPIMALRSSFGLLIQIPFFIAAYSYLSHLPALQGQSFLFIRDMGSPDSLFSIGSFKVNILPIAMTVINMTSGFLYTRGLALRDKLQTYGLALFFVVILYNSPAGLVMYWTMNNIFSLVKNVFYKLKNPLRTFYLIICLFITVFIIWLLLGHSLSTKRAVLVSIFFSFIYFVPLFVRLARYLINKPAAEVLLNSRLRLFLFSISSVSLLFLAGFLIPVLLVSSSTMEFSGIDGYGSPVYFIRNTFVQALAFFIVWPFLIYFLFPRKVQTILSLSFAILLVIGLVNAFMFQGRYGTLSTLLVFTNISSVDSKLSEILINIIVLLAFCLIPVILIAFKKTAVVNTAFSLVAFSLFLLSAIKLSEINRDYKEFKRIAAAGDSAKTVEPIFHFSKTGKNVVLLYLDRAQNRFVKPIFEESPELYEQFSGFTLYDNTVSFNGHTLIGAAPVFGGYEYTPESMNRRNAEKLVDKQNQSILMLPRIFTEQGENFSATVTDPSWANYSWIPDLSIFADYPSISAYNTEKTYLPSWYKTHGETFDTNITSTVLKRNILWYSLFRISPLALRPAFYNDGKYWSSRTNVADVNSFLGAYSVLDYLPELTDFDSKTENVFINFVNNTTHESLFLQAPDYEPVTNVTNIGNSVFKYDSVYHANAGSLKRVGEWLEYLKANGVYDNTRIVIVSDHGAFPKEDGFIWNSDFDKIMPGRYHPLLMVKDFGSKGVLSVDHGFMTNADTPTLLLTDVVKDPVNPFTNKKIDSRSKNDGALVCTDDIFMPYHNKSSYIFTAGKDCWFRVKDNIFNSDNWTLESEPKGGQ